MVSSTTHRIAYLQHLEQKKHPQVTTGSAPDATVAGEGHMTSATAPQSTISPLVQSSSFIRKPRNQLTRRLKNPSSSSHNNTGNNNHMPVWKQRQLRNLEQTHSHPPSAKDDESASLFEFNFPPPPPPPPPTQTTSSVSSSFSQDEEESIFSTSTQKERHLLLDSVVSSPETPSGGRTPASPDEGRVKESLNEEEDAREPPMERSHQEGPKEDDEKDSDPFHRFKFFQATSPKVTPKKTLDDKISGSSPLSSSASTPSNPKNMSSADGTHTTFFSSDDEEETHGDDTEENVSSPVSTPRRQGNRHSLAAAWQESIEKQRQQPSTAAANLAMIPAYTTPETETNNHNHQSRPKAEDECISANVPSFDSSSSKSRGREPLEDEKDNSTSNDPGEDPAVVMAKWQERIRQKHKRSHSVTREPETASSSSKPQMVERRSVSVDGRSRFEQDLASTLNSPDRKHNSIVTTANTTDTTSFDQHSMVVYCKTNEEESKETDQPLTVWEDQDFDTLYNSLVPFEEPENRLALLQSPEQDDNDADGGVAFDLLMSMIEDCENRWHGSSKLHRVVQPSPLSYLTMAHNETEQTKLIRLQQSEIAQLREQLQKQQLAPQPKQLPSSSSVSQTQTTTLSISTSRVVQQDASIVEPKGTESSLSISHMDYIDSVPLEHIEVNVIDDSDVCSITSGLTNLHDLMMMNRNSFGGDESAANMSSSIADPFHQQYYAPAESTPSLVPTKIVRRVPMELKAADGSSRKALYTGPVVKGQYTGFGAFQFNTGDVYKGEVRNGKMHGQGTYTYARRSKRNKNRPPKVLRGTFENNVFTGWDSNNIIWNGSNASKP